MDRWLSVSIKTYLNLSHIMYLNYTDRVSIVFCKKKKRENLSYVFLMFCGLVSS